MKEEIYLIDGSAYIYRAYHAITPLSNSKGMATHATLGFINMIKRLIREKEPQYLAIAFDSRGPVFRHEIYDQYKANRPPMPEDLRIQLSYIKKFVESSNILILKEQRFEADDIIASAATIFADLGHRVVIVSSDKDLLQLITEDVVIWDPMKDRTVDMAAVKNKYGVNPDQLLDFFALIGDSADNVPGVPGVGPKRARKLINTYSNLENLYYHIDDLQKSKMTERIVENRTQAYLSRQLIDLKTDINIPSELAAYSRQKADNHRLKGLYTELEFTGLLKDLNIVKKVPIDGFMTVQNRQQLDELIEALRDAKLLVIDTETTSLDAKKAQLVGLSLCTSLERAWYIPIGHCDEEGRLVKGQLLQEEVLAALRPFLLSTELLKVGHNLKYDFTVLWQQLGLELGGELADTLIAAYLTETGGRSLKLDSLCLARGLRLTSFEELTGDDKREACFAYIDIKEAGIYSCEDVYGTLVLWQELEPLLKDKGLMDLFRRVEMPIVTTLAKMEFRGICIDMPVLAILAREFSAELELLEEKIYKLADHEFNINSPRQLSQVLFEELGLPPGRKTKTGFSTDVAVLEKLTKKHQLPKLVLRYRTLTKLKSTYVEKLRQLQDPETGRVHTSFNQAVTATGRLSSSDPNLQNIPIRTEEGTRIRRAFIPAKGLVFLSADYSQIDLRVLAHYSKDHALIEAFRAGDDVHVMTGAEIFGISPLLVTSEMRRVAKTINFGIVYGMSSFGLANQLAIGRKEAQRFIDRYFRVYTGVKKFMEDIVRQTRESGYVTTLLGRRRSVPGINAKNRVEREFSERMAINTPIQGTAADIIKLAMIDCQKTIDKHGLSAKMLLQIHDELVFELPKAEVDIVQGHIKLAMENALDINVPLVINFAVGKNLAEPL